MQRVVCYSLVLQPPCDQSGLLRQLEASVTSLRRHNRDVPVVIFCYGRRPPGLERVTARLDVTVHDSGPYEARLAEAMPHAWQVLQHYPVLHKFMNFGSLGDLGAEQALLLDCDTYFAQDVELLFDRYAAASVYAREEPTCRRSHLGYDPSYLDEDALAALASSEGIATPPPFNVGVMLFNHGRWRELSALQSKFLSYAWRLMLWMARHPLESDQERAFGEGLGVELLRAEWGRLVTPPGEADALPFPSSNRWILDQVATWLALGWLSDGTYADFAPADVLQNGELMARPVHDRRWIMCHYFSQNTDRIAHWLGEPRALQSQPA